MLFRDFLKTTVLLSAGAATLLATLTVLSAATRDFDPVLITVSAAWWLIATAYGLQLGRRAETNPPIARLLAEARATTTLPEVRVGATLLNRLWALLLFTGIAGVAGILLPPVAGIATGFAIAWPLAIRRQEQAVAAIEERDAVRFYVERTSPVEAIRLVRAPGFGGDFLAVPS